MLAIIIGASVGGGVFLLIIIGVAIGLCIRQRRKHVQSTSATNIDSGRELQNRARSHNPGSGQKLPNPKKKEGKEEYLNTNMAPSVNYH